MSHLDFLFSLEQKVAIVTDIELIEQTALTGLPIILSTGMLTPEELDEAVEILNKHKSNFMLMHTDSNYPTKLEYITGQDLYVDGGCLANGI